MSEWLRFPCLEVEQPIGTFYIGMLEASQVAEVAYSDVRRMERREVEEWTGIERPLKLSRVREIQDYVRTVDATFPAGVILAVRSEAVRYLGDKGIMEIARDRDVAKILDGQHRIAGLLDYAGPKFQVAVTLFVDMDLEDQALVFATINLKQTKVSKSLAYDLFAYATHRSPQKSCHNIAVLLDGETGSPFAGRIKRLGVASGRPDERLTQATFVDCLLEYLSDNPMRDRDTLKRGRRIAKVDGRERDKYIFRNLFVDDRDEDIARTLWNYFGAVVARWPRAWASSDQGAVLGRTTGFRALMSLLRPMYLAVRGDKEVVPEAEFSKLLKRIGLSDDAFTTTTYVPGTTGETRLYKDLLAGVRLSDKAG